MTLSNRQTTIGSHSGHGGQHSGPLPVLSAITPERCPSCRRIAVHHQPGIVSVLGRRTQLRAEPGFVRLRDQVKSIAGLLEEKSAIPMVRDQMRLIQELQTDEWWQDVTMPMLERVRRRLRNLVGLIDKKARKPIYTDFEDDLGASTEIPLSGLKATDDFEKFKVKARSFLRAHKDHVVIHKLRMNRTLTPSDLSELERILVESGLKDEQIKKAREESSGLGVFVRSLVGMDRGAAKETFATFLNTKTLSANQIEFVNLVIDHLTEHGVMDAKALYESPFTDIAPQGPDGIVDSNQVDELLALLKKVRASAAA